MMLSMCSRLSLLLLSAVCLTATHAETESAYAYYIERTDTGGVRLTDRPSAELQWVRAPVTFSPGEVEIEDNSTSEPYVRIASPIESEAVRSNAGKLVVQAEFPPVESDDVSCELMLDGQWVATSKAGTFLLENLDRGPHRLKARLKDAQEKVLAVSEEVNFHLLRYAIPRD